MQRTTPYAWCFIAVFAVLGTTYEPSWAATSASANIAGQQARSQPKKDTDEDNSSQQEKTTNKKTETRQRSTNTRPDFNPSEKISEDFSVSFPVDI